MANPFKRKSGDPVAAAESKVQELRQRGEALQAQHGRVSAKRDSAAEEQRQVLLDDALLEKSGLAIAALDVQLAGLNAAIAENQTALADAEAGRAVAIDRATREAQAKAIETQRVKAEALMDRYLEISREFSEAMLDPAFDREFHSQEIGLLAGRIGSDVGGARERWRTNLDHKIAELRADPPPKPAPMQPQEQLGQPSPFRRKFAASDGGAIGDRKPDREYFGGFAETER